MSRSLVRRATACAGVLVLLTAATAVAGTGVGARFDLGETNRVNETSVLTGADAAPMLTVRNTSKDAGATALNLAVEDGKPPLKTNSGTRVANLNADAVDGYDANDMTRVALHGTEDGESALTFGAQASFSITAPKDGFVLLTGQLTGGTFSENCAPCFVHLRLRDVSNNQTSPFAAATVGTGAAAYSYTTLPVTYVFPVAAGEHIYQLEAGISPPEFPVTLTNPVLTGIYSPFGPTGTKSLNPSAPAARR